MRADLSAARNTGERHALSIGCVFQAKAAILTELVHRFSERRARSARSDGRGSTTDPRSSFPCCAQAVESACLTAGSAL